MIQKFYLVYVLAFVALVAAAPFFKPEVTLVSAGVIVLCIWLFGYLKRNRKR